MIESLTHVAVATVALLVSVWMLARIRRWPLARLEVDSSRAAGR